MLRQPTPLAHSPPRAAGLTPAVFSTAHERPDSAACSTPHGRPVETSDAGRVQIHKPFVAILAENGLDSFEALWNIADGHVIRRVGSRETRRIEIQTPQGLRPFYLKRFGASRWRDSVRALLHLGWPIHGARPEWEAIWQFIAAGIPTVTPVACGESGKRSLLITEALPSRYNLLEFVSGGTTNRALLVQVAEITRRMHAAGLHHQDYYLNHMLLCGDVGKAHVHVIDLGRARRQPRLGMRWIIKDLSQLDFSARAVSASERLRFLRLYLDRPFCPDDRRLVRRIVAKSRRIAAHTAKHDL